MFNINHLVDPVSRAYDALSERKDDELRLALADFKNAWSSEECRKYMGDLRIVSELPGIGKEPALYLESRRGQVDHLQRYGRTMSIMASSHPVEISELRNVSGELYAILTKVKAWEEETSPDLLVSVGREESLN